MRKPTKNRLTFPYGATSKPYSKSNPHAGSDYSINPDPYWYAPEPIIVTLVTTGKQCGKQIDFQSVNGKRKYRACHNSIIYAKQSRGYQEGFRMARMGKTGYAFGEHLHLVMWVDGKRVDPEKTLNNLIRGKIDDMYKKKYEALVKNYKHKIEVAKTWKRQHDVQKKRADAREKQIVQLQKLLRAEKSKPPTQVIKEVQKIVEKEVLPKDAIVVERSTFNSWFDKLRDWFRR